MCPAPAQFARCLFVISLRVVKKLHCARNQTKHSTYSQTKHSTYSVLRCFVSLTSGLKMASLTRSRSRSRSRSLALSLALSDLGLEGAIARGHMDSIGGHLHVRMPRRIAHL
jgi:hypothetical protein